MQSPCRPSPSCISCRDSSVLTARVLCINCSILCLNCMRNPLFQYFSGTFHACRLSAPLLLLRETPPVFINTTSTDTRRHPRHHKRPPIERPSPTNGTTLQVSLYVPPLERGWSPDLGTLTSSSVAKYPLSGDRIFYPPLPINTTTHARTLLCNGDT